MPIDNSKHRLHDVFFYGLYMDPDILRQKAVEPRNPRLAAVEGYALRIGNQATLLRAGGQTAHGVIYSLTHDEIHSLYWGGGLNTYRAEAVLARVDREDIPALTCNLLDAPGSEDTNPEYAVKLKQVMSRLGVPVTFDDDQK